VLFRSEGTAVGSFKIVSAPEGSNYAELVAFLSDGISLSYTNAASPGAYSQTSVVKANDGDGYIFKDLKSGSYTITETGIHDLFRYYSVRLGDAGSLTSQDIARASNLTLNLDAEADEGLVVSVFNIYAPDKPTVDVTIIVEVDDGNGNWVTEFTKYGLTHTARYRVRVIGTPSDPDFEWTISGEIEDLFGGLLSLPGGGAFTIDKNNPVKEFLFTIFIGEGLEGYTGYGTYVNTVTIKQISNNVNDFIVPPTKDGKASVTLRSSENPGGGPGTPAGPGYPSPVTTIPNPPPPITSLPEIIIPKEDDYVIIDDDEDTALGNLPKTGTSGVRGLGLIATGIGGLMALFITKKKRKDTDAL
jgi:LPXTG-motif cell wall-anchored protein